MTHEVRIYTIDQWQKTVESNLTPRLKSGDGGGTSDGMDSRVTKLETQMEFVRDDLREIKGDLKTIIGRLGELPTKRDLTTNTLTIVVIGLAVLAITVGGIIGGLALLR